MYGSPVIITSENFRDLTELELRKNAVAARKVLYEPEPKNTAAAIALCCRYLELENSNQYGDKIQLKDSFMIAKLDGFIFE